MILSSQVLILRENIPKHPEGIKVAKVKLKTTFPLGRWGIYCSVKFCF